MVGELVGLTSPPWCWPMSNRLKAGAERGFYLLQLFKTLGSSQSELGKMPQKPGRAALEEKSIQDWKLV